MTVLTHIPNGAGFGDIRDSINHLLDLANGSTSTGNPTPPPPSLTGFYANGATNPALKAMFARGYGRIDQKGDSTTMGQGGGTTADSHGFTNARPNRVSAQLAVLYQSAGVNMRDAAVFGDGGLKAAANLSIYGAYDPRVSTGDFAFTGDQGFAGGAIINKTAAGNPYTFTPDYPVDTFEMILFAVGGQAVTLLIDGNQPASLTVDGVTTANGFTPLNTGSGFVKAIATAAGAGTHTFSVNSAGVYFNSIRARNSAAPSIDIYNHGSCFAFSADQATAGSGYKNLDALGYDAPDLTTINLGINDINRGDVTTGAYTTNLQKIITKAKASGDVLLLFPHPFSGPTTATIQSYNDAAKALAASNGVAFFSLWEHYGSAFTSTFGQRLFDGTTHPAAPLYAEIAALEKQAIDLMRAA